MCDVKYMLPVIRSSAELLGAKCYEGYELATYVSCRDGAMQTTSSILRRTQSALFFGRVQYQYQHSTGRIINRCTAKIPEHDRCSGCGGRDHFY